MSGKSGGSSRDHATSAGDARVAARPATLTGVTETFTAKHRDPVMDEGLHEHTWAVTAFYPAEPFRDGRCMKMALREVLSHLQVDGILPPELWSGEAIAATVARLLANCIGARVTRPEGFEAWVWL